MARREDPIIGAVLSGSGCFKEGDILPVSKTPFTKRVISVIVIPVFTGTYPEFGMCFENKSSRGASKWGFPGGGPDDDDKNSCEAARRELCEELIHERFHDEISIAPGDLLGEIPRIENVTGAPAVVEVYIKYLPPHIHIRPGPEQSEVDRFSKAQIRNTINLRAMYCSSVDAWGMYQNLSPK